MSEKYYAFTPEQILDYVTTNFKLVEWKEKGLLNDYKIERIDNGNDVTYDVYLKPNVTIPNIKVNFLIFNEKCGE